MNILFDIISAQAEHYNGAAEYTRTLFLAVREQSKRQPVNLHVIYDSRIPVLFNEMTFSELEKDKNLIIVDVAKYKRIQDIIVEFKIDELFICLAQRWNRYNLEGISCEVFCTIHDLWHFECEQNKIWEYLNITNTMLLFKQKLRHWIHPKGTAKNRYNELLNFLNNTKNLTIVSVSEYTKASIMFNLGIQDKKILVSWSPSKKTEQNQSTENSILRDLINTKKKYYLIVSADRPMKNAKKVLRAFHQYCQITKNKSVIVTVGLQKQVIEEQVPLPFISESDLENAYKHCYALIYGSLFEGFGYPPVEAMKYSKPVFASNVCSIREVLGDAPIYFSPFYDTDIYHSFFKLNDTNYDRYCQKSHDRATYIENKQKSDLESLVERIVNI